MTVYVSKKDKKTIIGHDFPDDLEIQILKCRLKYLESIGENKYRWVYFAIRLVGGTTHSNAVFIDFFRKRVYLIEPHIKNKWDRQVLTELKKALTEIELGNYEYRSLRSELDSCPVKLQGSDSLCQSWALFLTYLYLRYEGEYNLGSLLNIIGTKKIKKRLIDFIYFVYHQMKNSPDFQKHLKKDISHYKLGDHPYLSDKMEIVKLLFSINK